MDYKEIKAKYENAKRQNAIGMLVVITKPGQADKNTYYRPVSGKNGSSFEEEALKEFGAFLRIYNSQCGTNLTPRDFSKSGPNDSSFDLQSITYTKLA